MFKYPVVLFDYQMNIDAAGYDKRIAKADHKRLSWKLESTSAAGTF